MKNLKKLGATVALTCALGFPVFAGQTETPPCAQPEPGQTETPPCAGVLGDVDTPPGSSTAPGDMGSGGASLTEIAADVLLNLLPLF